MIAFIAPVCGAEATALNAMPMRTSEKLPVRPPMTTGMQVSAPTRFAAITVLLIPNFAVRPGTNGRAMAAGSMPARLSVPSRDAFPNC